MEKSKIMIVEGNRTMSSDIKHNLRYSGYKKVFHYYNGIQAIDNVINILPDIVLIDIKLKGSMDGIETAKMIRLLYNIPVVYFTTNSEISTLQKAMLTQPFDFVIVPCDERILQLTIESALQKNKSERLLMESEAQNRSIAEVFDGYIYMNDSNYNIKFLNKKLKNKIGNSSLNEKCYKAIYQRDTKCPWCPMQEILKGKNVRKMRFDEKEACWFKEIHIPFNAQKGQILKQSMLLDVTERKHKREKIKKTLFDKDVMFSEIHHRIKNNLQIISSLLNIQSSQLTDNLAIQALKESRSRVNSMMLIHEKLYNTKHFSHINFEDYLKELTSYIIELYPKEELKINFTINAQNVVLDIDTAVPAALIINELITNSLKHAFSDHIREGKIDIDLKQYRNGEYYLKVTDNGVGMPENTDIANGSTFGMQIVRLLTKQLAGEMNIKVDNGTEVLIKFNEFGYRKNGNGRKYNI